jgi:hypothetical protein
MKDYAFMIRNTELFMSLLMPVKWAGEPIETGMFSMTKMRTAYDRLRTRRRPAMAVRVAGKLDLAGHAARGLERYGLKRRRNR